MLALENSEEASAAEQCEDRRKEHLGSEARSRGAFGPLHILEFYSE